MLAKRAVPMCLKKLALLRSLSSRVTEGEKHMTEVLNSRFPNATSIKVTDISGGCGSMYQVVVESMEFAGKSRVLQHKCVTDALKAEMPSMHGIVIETRLPPSTAKKA